MATYNFKLSNANRVVRSNSAVDISLNSPFPVFNFTSIDNYFNITTTSGIVFLTTYPTGIDIFNRNLGAVFDYNFFNDSMSIYRSLGFESNLRRGGTSISGSKFGGRV